VRASTKTFQLVAVVAAAFAVPLAGSASAASPAPYRHHDGHGFRDVLPPGTNGFVNGPQLLQFRADGTRPPHNNDQYAKYRDLAYAAPTLNSKSLTRYFKDSSFGVRPANVGRTYSPCQGVTIVRDTAYGVPHIYGATRAAAMCGIGYATAEDRLFFIDVLRHAGRADLSTFAGGANRSMDEETWADTPYTEKDLQRQVNYAPPGHVADANLLRTDIVNYDRGINQYIAEARLDPSKMPGEYAAVLQVSGPADFKPTDSIAIAALVGGIFGKGGGGELGSANVLRKAQTRFGRRGGRAVWRDFRTANDPEAPTTVHHRRFPYERPPRHRRGTAVPDAASLKPSDVVASSSGVPAPVTTAGGLLGGAFPSAASNALLISARESATGRPIAVMGPQVAYFSPQILMEQDVHAPTIDARGAAFPGVNLYVELGHGRDYAWSATSAGQDIVDTFALPLCNTNGSKPALSADHYAFRGKCLPFEVLTKDISWTPNPGDQTQQGSETLRTLRSKMGIVVARGRVRGKPVAYTKLRTTYFHEVDSAVGFSKLNDPSKVRGPRDFQRATHDISYTFNWFYADNRHIAYFNSGANPVRDPRADTDLPVFGRYAWRDYHPNALTQQRIPEKLTAFGRHPQAVDQNYLSSWNNKQAPGYRAADGNFGYGSIFRVDSLDRRIESGIRGPHKMSLPELARAMEEAGTVDMRARELLPYLLEVIRTRPIAQPAVRTAVAKLRAWLADGAHRIDRNKDGTYEHTRAIQIMDSWFPQLLEAEFRPTLGQKLFDTIRSVISFDDAPGGVHNGTAHVGSAYDGGWYHYVHKDLRTLLDPASVRGRYSRIYCGGGDLGRCRARLIAALARSLDDNPYGDNAGCGVGDDQMCNDAVKFRAVGGVTQPDMPWINRPTYQQAVSIQHHR
jgi:acyl-homoserine lactone acylase PvdQ